MSILEKVDFIRNLENANQHPPPKKKMPFYTQRNGYIKRLICWGEKGRKKQNFY